MVSGAFSTYRAKNRADNISACKPGQDWTSRRGITGVDTVLQHILLLQLLLMQLNGNLSNLLTTPAYHSASQNLQTKFAGCKICILTRCITD
jgi:hypothetical protein